MNAGDVVTCIHGEAYWLLEFQYNVSNSTFIAKVIDVDAAHYLQKIGNTYSFRLTEVVKKGCSYFDYDLGEKD